MKNIINIIVKDEENGSRIDSFISKKEKKLSRTRIKNLIIQKNLKLNDILTINPSQKVVAGDKINLEDFFSEIPTDYKILLEEHNVFASEGQIPVAHYTLNSTSVITKGNVRAADISVRDTGDITLEDATDNAEGYLVLNSTSGSSTNAGENIDLEGATGITY